MRTFAVGIICLLLAVSSFGLESGLESPSNRKLAINYEVVLNTEDVWWTSSAVSPNGGAVFCFGATDSCGWDFSACMIYDADGGQVGDTIYLPNAEREMPSVAILPDDMFVVAFAAGPCTNYIQGYFMVYDMTTGESPFCSPIRIDSDSTVCSGDTDNYGPHVSVLSNGYLLFVGDYYGFDSASAIWARIFTSTGEAISSSVQVDEDIFSSCGSSTWYAQGVPLDNDGFAVVWNEDGDNIYIRYFDKRTRPNTESILINSDYSKWSNSDYSQGEVYARALSNGNILVNWEGDAANYDNYESWIKIFDPKGKQVTKAMNIVAGNYSKGAYEVAEYGSNNNIAQLTNGSIVIVWEQDASCCSCTSDYALVWRLFSEDGQPLTPVNTLVNSTTFPYQDSNDYIASVAARGDGGWVITYTADADSPNYLWGICFDSTGAPVPWSFPAFPSAQSASMEARTSGKYAAWVGGVHL